MVTHEWVAIHRKHHAKCETAEDPHSPQFKGINRVLWGGVFLYVAESRNKETMARYSHGTPSDWLERKVYTPWHKLGIVLMLGINLACFGVLPGLALWLVQMVWIPFWAAGVINGLGHFWGYRNFSSDDASTNLVPWGILIGGEELHNNHHAYATSAKMSSQWFEFDLGWTYIRSLEILGLAKVKKTIPKLKFCEPRQIVDVDMLQAVITHRYEVMTRFMRAQRISYGDELARLRAAHGDRFDIKKLRVWLAADESSLSTTARSKLAEAFAANPALARLHALQRDLAALWARSTVSRDQLLAQLGDWCQRAEASGLQPLRDFSMRLRSYSV